MRTLSKRFVILQLVALALIVLAPVRHAVAVNEFPEQPPRKPDPMVRMRKPIPDVQIRVLRAPNVVGQRVSDARAVLERAGLRPGREASQQTREAAPGTVIRQEPAPGTAVKPSDAIHLWIASAPPSKPGGSDDVGPPSSDGKRPRTSDGPIITPEFPRGPIFTPESPRLAVVPDLVNRPATEAPARLERSRLRMGNQRREESEAAVGTVLAQSPTAGARVAVGSPVSIVVAAPILITVPDLVGRPVSEAAARLERSRLTIGDQRREETEAPPETVVSQAPGPGGRVPVGTSVHVVVATPTLVTVPDLVGTVASDAPARLEQSRLGLGQQRREESETTAGTVLSQQPGAGRRVPAGTRVSIAIAAPMLVTVPDLIGNPASEAGQLLDRTRLTLGAQRREESDRATGTVVRQTPSAGERVPVGTAVGVVVAAPLLVTVPDLTGRSASEAERLLTERRLLLGQRRDEEAPVRPGSVVKQSRPAGARVRPGTAIDVALAIAPAAVPPTPSGTPPPPPTARGPAPTRAPAPSTPPAPGPGPVQAPTPTPIPIATGDSTPTVAEVNPPPTAAGARGWHPVAWVIGSMLVLAGAGTAYHYRPRRPAPKATAVAPTFDFTSHWDTGSFRLGPAGSLCAGPGLRLDPGIEMGVPELSSEHLVKSVVEEDARP